MAEPVARSGAVSLVGLGGRVVLAAVVMIVIVVAGGLAIALSPVLIAVLAGTAIAVAVLSVWWRTAARGLD